MKKREVSTPEQFLQKRGLTIDGAIYMRAMMEVVQQLKQVRRQVKTGEVSASVGDMIDYIENEITYIRYVEGDDNK
jgi:hypothetical protein